MYAVAPGTDATELHVTGRGRGIREIDLCSVLNTPEDRALLLLITSFDLSHNSIAHLQHLDALAALTRLDASHNQIADIGALPCTITRLDLSHNRLIALDGIGALPHLRELDVRHNSLRALTGLSSSQPLEVLRADANRVTGLCGLEGMAQLRVLSAEGNCVESAGELLAIATMPALEVLSLRGNAVAGAPGFRSFVAQLQRAILSLDGTPLLRGSEGITTREDDAPEIIAVVEEGDEEETGGVVGHERRESEKRFGKNDAIGTRLKATGNTHTPIGNGRVILSPAERASKDTRAAETTTTTATSTNKSLAQSAGVGKKSVVAPARSATKTAAAQRAMRQTSNQTFAHKSQSIAESAGSSAAHVNEETHTQAATKGYASAHVSATSGGEANAQGTRELREARVLAAELRKENEFLRGRIHTVEAHLHEARRVVSSQLDEMNALREQCAGAKAREAALRERLDRTARGARAAERRSHAAAQSLHTKCERMRAAYDAQIADLRQRLRRRGGTGRGGEGEKERECEGEKERECEGEKERECEGEKEGEGGVSGGGRGAAGALAGSGEAYGVESGFLDFK